MDRQELRIGDEVFYTLEDYESGEEIIHKGYIREINADHNIRLGSIDITSTFYELSDSPNGDPIGIGMQRNNLYTIQDLFKIKNAYEYQQRKVEKLDEQSIGASQSSNDTSPLC